jgi:hypothetical protein
MFDEATSYKLIDTNSFDRFKDLNLNVAGISNILIVCTKKSLNSFTTISITKCMKYLLRLSLNL